MRRLAVAIVSWVAGLGFSSLAPAGEISGNLTIQRPLTRARLSVQAYQARGAALDRPPTQAGGGNEFERIVVYLAGTSLRAPVPLRTRLDQRNKQFTRQILAVPAGSTVEFGNDDPIFHNVFSLSKIKSFDLGYYPRGESRSIEFPKPGVVQVFCHLHPNMASAIVVTPSAWYTAPQEDGSYAFHDVPAGDVDVMVWHRSAGFFHKRASVPESGTVRVNLTLPVREEK